MPNFSPVTDTTNFRAAYGKLAPPWLNGNDGYRFGYSWGLCLDALAEYLRIGVRQGFPTTCDEEAISYLALDSRIRRGPAEPSDSIRERIRVAKTTWKRAGSPKSVLGQLAAYYSPADVTVRYVSNGYDDQGNTVSDWWTLSAGTYSYTRASPANWNWDGQFGDFRFWIIVHAPLLPLWNWDDSARYWDEPGLLWGYRDGQVIYDLFAIVSDWKAAGSHLGGLILSPETGDYTVQWGTGTWGTGTWGMTTTGLVFDPSASPGYPLPNGDWFDPANRLPIAQYFFVPGD